MVSKKTGLAMVAASMLAVMTVGCSTQSECPVPSSQCPTQCPTDYGMCAKDRCSCKAKRHHRTACDSQCNN